MNNNIHYWLLLYLIYDVYYFVFIRWHIGVTDSPSPPKYLVWLSMKISEFFFPLLYIRPHGISEILMSNNARFILSV